jgi:hypothetical protein
MSPLLKKSGIKLDRKIPVISKRVVEGIAW